MNHHTSRHVSNNEKSQGRDILYIYPGIKVQKRWRIFSLKQIEYGVYGDLLIIYPKPYSIYLRGTITLNPELNPLRIQLGAPAAT